MNEKRWLVKGKTLVLALVLIALAGSEAWAIPAFARKYKTSCATCHEAFPRLNAVGEAFRLNGYKFNDDEMYIKDEPVEMGDEAYKKVWPKAIWPSDIPGLPPLSVIVRSDYEWDIGATKDASNQFVFPKEVKLLGAGAFGDNMSFFAELVFSRGGGHGGGHGGGGAEDETEVSVEGWIQYEDLFGLENAFNFRLGTVGMQELGLFTARNHNRITVNPYLYTMWTMPAADHHETEEALEDRLGDEAAFVETNDFVIHAQPGIELNGFGRWWRYAVGITNGNGESVTDNNSQKDLYAQLAFKLGGLGFDGSGGQDGDVLGGAESWRDNSLTFSLFGYSGTQVIEIAGDDASWRGSDDFWRVGFGILGRYRDLQIGAGYIFGENEAPYGALTKRDVDSRAWFVEAQYFVFPWLIPNIRYEGLHLDLPLTNAVITRADRERFIVGVKALLRANVSLAIEGRFYTKDERQTKMMMKGETNDDNQVVISANFAF